MNKEPLINKVQQSRLQTTGEFVIVLKICNILLKLTSKVILKMIIYPLIIKVTNIIIVFYENYIIYNLLYRFIRFARKSMFVL